MPASPAIYLFQSTKLVPVSSAAIAVEKCADVGGDILHYRPSGPPWNFKAITANYFSRDYTAAFQDEKLKISGWGNTLMLCQSKFGKL